VRLDPTVTPEEIEQSLRATARLQLGLERSGQLDHRLAHYARMLALIAGAEVDFAGDPPDCSGLSEESDDG
jgi:hypothetical protein